MIAGLLNHFTHLPARKPEHPRIRQLRLAELPHGNFRNEQNSVTVGIIQHQRILWVVNRPRQRGVQHLHVVVVVSYRAAGLREPFPRRILVPGDACQSDALPIDEQMAIANFQGTYAECLIQWPRPKVMRPIWDK